MEKTRNHYAQEYRRQVIDLARAGRSVAEPVHEFDPSEQTIDFAATNARQHLRS